MIDARVMAFCLGLSLVSTLLVGLVPALRVGGAAFGEGLALHAGETRTTSDRQGERLRTLLVAGQIAMTLVLLIAAGPADSQLRASHVGVARLRIERERRRRADRQGDAAPAPLRRARAHPCVRARRARSHPAPAGRDLREPDQLGAVRHDVHPRRIRHRRAAEADARCRQAEDRGGLFQDHGDSAAGGTRVYRTGHGGSAERGDRQRAHRARLLSGWSGRGARPARAPGRSRRVADGRGRGRGHPSDGTRYGSAAHDLRAVPAGARATLRPAVRVVRRAHGHTRQGGRRHPRGNTPRRARSADPEHA